MREVEEQPNRIVPPWRKQVLQEHRIFRSEISEIVECSNQAASNWGLVTRFPRLASFLIRWKNVWRSRSAPLIVLETSALSWNREAVRVAAISRSRSS
jgi:hypothetical protein